MKRITICFALLTAIFTTKGQSLEGLFSQIQPEQSVTVEAIAGTWVYSKPAVKLKSSNALANMGIDAISAQIVEKLTPYYEKIGLKEGCFAITFTSDGKVSTQMMGKTLTGTYTISEDGKKLNIGYKEIFSADMAMKAGNLSLMLGGEKFLSFILTIVDVWPSSESAEALKTLLGNYDSILAGFEFKRQADPSVIEGTV